MLLLQTILIHLHLTQVKTALDLKQDSLTFNTPSSNNTNPSTSLN